MIEREFNKAVAALEGNRVRVIVYEAKANRPFVVNIAEFFKNDAMIAQGKKVSARITNNLNMYFSDDYRIDVSCVDSTY